MHLRIVQSVGKYSKELNAKIKKGKIKHQSGLVMTPETFNKVFSPERIKLLQKIYKNNIKNIYQLARELGKPYEVVFRNIQYLAGIGLVRIKDKDSKKVPYVAGPLLIDMFGDKAEV